MERASKYFLGVGAWNLQGKSGGRREKEKIISWKKTGGRVRGGKLSILGSQKGKEEERTVHRKKCFHVLEKKGKA